MISGLRERSQHGRARRARTPPPRWRWWCAARARCRRCPSARYSSAIPSMHSDMPYLDSEYARCGANHCGLRLQRRRERQDVRVGRLLQVRQAGARGHEGAARVDLLDQVVAASCRSARCRARLIAEALLMQMSMPPKVSAQCFDRRPHAGLLAHVHDQRQRLAAGALDLRGGGVDGARAASGAARRSWRRRRCWRRPAPRAARSPARCRGSRR